MGLLLGRSIAPLHDITQLVFRTRVEKVERVVFQGSVKSWIADERAATISQRLVSQFLGTIERGQLVSKLLVQSALRIPRGTTLHQINCEGG